MVHILFSDKPLEGETITKFITFEQVSFYLAECIGACITVYTEASEPQVLRKEPLAASITL